jgi:hypothetical protein
MSAELRSKLKGTPIAEPRCLWTRAVGRSRSDANGDANPGFWGAPWGGMPGRPVNGSGRLIQKWGDGGWFLQDRGGRRHTAAWHANAGSRRFEHA